MPSFPLTTSAWIPVYDTDARTTREVGITEALLRAHRLQLTGETEEGLVLLRLLAAVFDAAAGPTTPPEWLAAWHAPTLDGERITAYLDKFTHRLDLFHPYEPAFQCGELTAYSRDARVLHPAYLAGAAGPHFTHSLRLPEGDFPAWPPEQAARNLLVLIGYDVAGIKRAVPGDPLAKKGKIYGAQVAHIAQLTHLHIGGRTLKDTLLLNLPPQPRREGDAPVWERATPAAPMTAREPTGRLDVLTWPNRRMRLRPDCDGHVDAVAWHDGDRLTDSWQQLAHYDPMSMWRTKDDRWVPQNVADAQGLIVPWKVAGLVLDPAGDEGGVHCAAAQHLARLLDAGLLANYGPLTATASYVQHNNQHKSVISDVTRAHLPLADGAFLTNPENRADLAATARATNAIRGRIKQIIRNITPPNTPYADRVPFTPLYDQWQQAARLLARDPAEGRAMWRSMLHERADDFVDELPLRPMDKARAQAEIGRILHKQSMTAHRTPSAADETKTATPALTIHHIPSCPPTAPMPNPRPKPAEPEHKPNAVPPPPGTTTRKTSQRCVGCGRRLPKEADLSRCERCGITRRGQDRAYRKHLAEALFPPDTRTALLQRLTAGEELADVCADLDLTTHRVHGFRAYDEEWGSALDQALMDGRNPDLDHGTEQTYRFGRCRCPECRTAHNTLRG